MSSRAIEWLRFEAACETWRTPTPSSFDAPCVTRYLGARSKRAPSDRLRTRTALRQFLEEDFEPGATIAKYKGMITPLYTAYVPDYIAFLKQHRGMREPRSQEIYLRALFGWLHRHGVTSIERFEFGNARSFLADQGHLTKGTLAGVTSIVRGFVSYLHLRRVLAEDWARKLEAPRVYRDQKVVAVLAPPEVDRVLARCDRTTALGKRNYVILLLAARYGLRPSDIRTLTLDNVRWREGKIAHVQSKTQHPAELPLLPEVVDALVDYIRNGRPATDAREIIVRHRAPFRALGKSNAFWAVMESCLWSGGVASSQRGLRLLRHSAATNMMKRGVPFDQIAGVLGHRVHASAGRYLAVDIESLRAASLSETELFK